MVFFGVISIVVVGEDLRAIENTEAENSERTRGVGTV